MMREPRLRYRILMVIASSLSLAPQVAGCTRVNGHNDSWQYGYRHVDDFVIPQIGRGVSPKIACESIARIGATFDHTLNREDVIAGYHAGLKDRGRE